MKRLYQGIVDHPKSIILFFLAAAVIGMLLQPLVGVNYDMTDYLPEGTPSTISLERMQQEFTGGIPNARVMVKDVTIPQALEYKEKLLACEGVDAVLWLDDAVSIYQPLSQIDRDTLDSYYKDCNALFTVTIAEGQEITATDAIRAVIGQDNAMSGNAVSTAVATTSTVSEISQIASFAVAFVMLVLFLTTSSWLEPVVVLIGLGVAIVINMGSNLIFGEISFVTNAAGAILQLAVSLDYSVFLLHRFEESQAEYSDPREAMVDALVKSTSSILSSGLTTVIGFVALVFMRFGIGPDLGLALAKGVAISLVTVFVFMPVLILSLHRPLQKLRHRSFVPSFHKWGQVVCRVMLPCVCVFLLLIVPSFLASNSNTYYYGSSYIFGGETQLGADTKAIEDVYGKSDTYVLLVPRGSTATQRQLSDDLQALPEVKSILSYVDTVGSEIPMSYLDSDTLSQLVSDDYSRMVLNLEVDNEGEKAFALVEKVRVIADMYYPGAYYLAGSGVSTYDLMDTITADTLKVNMIAICAVFVVLLLTMKSITLPIILVASIETAIWINLAMPYFRNAVVFYIAYLIISSIQLGATVDYAILFTDRYLEFRHTMPKKQAVVQTVSAVTVSVLTSGTVLTVVGFLLGMISSHGILSQLGMFLGWGGLLSMAMVLLVLPGLLYLTDGLIQHTTMGLRLVDNRKKQEASKK